MTGDLLTVPGARIHHEILGAGPVLLLIPGGSGDAATFGQLAPLLARRHTVLSYDRRGYSRSPADSPAPDAGWLAEDVADALALLDRYSPGEPALVFGSSSGAIIGLELLARHPERVRLLVAHEPPLLGLLPDADARRAFLDTVHAIAARDGVPAAMRHFNRHVGIPEPQLPPPDQLPHRSRRCCVGSPATARTSWSTSYASTPPWSRTSRHCSATATGWCWSAGRIRARCCRTNRI